MFDYFFMQFVNYRSTKSTCPTPTCSNEMLLKSLTFLIGGYIFKASATSLVLARTTGGYSMHSGDRFTHNICTKVVAVEFSAWFMIQNRYSVNYNVYNIRIYI